MQYRSPVGRGPSGKTCPRCPPQREQVTSTLRIPNVLSSWESTFSSAAGWKKLGQPQPESNFESDRNNSCPQAAHLYTPGVVTPSYSPVNGRSVPFSRSTRYCSGVNSLRHSSSVFLIFSVMFILVALDSRWNDLASVGPTRRMLSSTSRDQPNSL